MSLLIFVMLLGMNREYSPNDVLWLSLDQAVEEAVLEDKAILVYVYAPNCGACLKMEKEVFPELEPLLSRLALAKVNYDDNESAIEAFDQSRTALEWSIHLGAEATPSFILLQSSGSIITRVSGFVEKEGFGLLLAFVSTGAFEHSSFEEYAESINEK